MTTPAPATRDLRDLPKGHLHLHMEAAMRPATLTRLSQKLGIDEAPTTGETPRRT